MSKLYRVFEGKNGWSEWIHPISHPKPYRMACCDCGLVHNMQFKVTLYRGKPRLIFRASRNERATAAMRRKYDKIHVIKRKKK